jgi:VWFA-related protein
MTLCKFVLKTYVLVLGTSLIYSPMLFAQAAPAALPSGQTLRVNAREVVLDINVTDAKGNYVHGLTLDKFTVLEDGKQMSPRSFREYRSDQEQAEPASAARESLPPNTFANTVAPATTRPLNILLLDSLDTPVATQSIVKQRMLDFVDKMPAGTRVAVFSLSPTGQLSVVQGFTADPELLKAALKSKKLNLGLPILEDTGQDVHVDVPTSMFEGQQNYQADTQTQAKQSSTQPPPPQVAYDQDVDCMHAAMRGQYTFTAINQIARYLSGVPGRKNLIWYTGLFPGWMSNKHHENCYDFRQEMIATEGMLNYSHVSVFTVDPRALDILAKNPPNSIIVQRLNVEHLEMEAVAEATNGKAIYNTNDLAGAARQAIEYGANYYTIGYTPTNQTMDTRRRSITVKVDQPGLTLNYKNNYLALPPGIQINGKAMDKATPLQSAMLRGSLQPTEILFHVGVTSAGATDTILPAGNNADPKAMKPPYRHLTLNYNIDINGIQFDSSPDGSYHGQFEYAVMVYNNDDGKTVNSSVMAAKPNVPLAVYQSMLDSGANVRQEVAVPAKGDYILRIGVHDMTTDHVGAIEIPVSAIKP